MLDAAGIVFVVAGLAALVYFRVLKPPPPKPHPRISDLFSLSVDPGLAATPLKELDFVVFDTEATGLRPSTGDEMVQLAGVKISNGSIRYGDQFNQMVRPSQPIPPASTLIHGITDAMVQDAPSPKQVDRDFREFNMGTILVAHCAAFDMAMLGWRPGSDKVNFDQPVLDTMLLAFVLEPTHFDLSLDTLAEKYNVQIHGRHTAIGDATATAEIFLRLIEPLQDAGIATLGDALAACRRTAARPEFKVSF
jgi:DNA polymerase-3 subunit epsilon